MDVKKLSSLLLATGFIGVLAATVGCYLEFGQYIFSVQTLLFGSKAAFNQSSYTPVFFWIPLALLITGIILGMSTKDKNKLHGVNRTFSDLIPGLTSVFTAMLQDGSMRKLAGRFAYMVLDGR